MAVNWDLKVIGPTTAYFGEAVTYFNQRVANYPITGVFDEAYLELTPMGAGEMVERFDLSLGSPGAISTERPVLGVQLSQFPPDGQPAQGDILIARGMRYVVREARPDGHGAAKLMLNQIGFG